MVAGGTEVPNLFQDARLHRHVAARMRPAIRFVLAAFNEGEEICVNCLIIVIGCWCEWGIYGILTQNREMQEFIFFDSPEDGMPENELKRMEIPLLEMGKEGERPIAVLFFKIDAEKREKREEVVEIVLHWRPGEA